MAPNVFNEQMFASTLNEKSKIKVGIVTEIPFLPVSASVKRAIAMSRKALEELGYQVVDAPITPEHYAEAKKYLIAMMSSVYGELSKEFDAHGEELSLTNYLTFVFYFSSPWFKSFACKVVKMIGMGRFASFLG